MPRARFSLAVCRSKTTLVLLGMVCLVSGPVGGQERKEPVDRARDAMRREVEAKTKETAAQFARLKALAVPAPVVAPVVVQVEGQAFVVPVAQRGQSILEEVQLDADPDEDAPPHLVRIYSEQAFDFYVFGGTGNTELFRARLDLQLRQHVEGVARRQRLTLAQKEKLRLAGKGDIKRHFDEIEAKRKEFTVVRTDPVQGRDFVRELIRFRATQAPLFGDGSLFAKVLKRINESTDESAEKPLPGSKLELRTAMERANAIVVGTDLKPLVGTGNPYLSIWCADVTITHCFQGDVARGKLRLNAISVSPPESLPTERTDGEFLLFIERSDGDGIKLHRVIKLLRATKEDVRAVEDLLSR